MAPRLALLAAALVLLIAAPDASAYLYWTNANPSTTGSNTVGRAYLDGTGVTQSFIGGTQLPEGVAEDGAHVYWADFVSDSIGRANLDGTGVNPNFITGANSPDGLAVDGTYLYWANFTTPSIGRAKLNGTDVNQNFIPPASGIQGPEGLAVDGSHIWWANVTTSTIGRANLNGTGVTPAFLSAPDPRSVAVDGTYVYWGNFSQGTIGRATLAGAGTTQNFITGGSQIRDLAVGGGKIYWSNQDRNTIGRANANGSGVNQSFIIGASAPWSVDISADTTPPQTTITSGPSGAVRSTSATFGFTSSEAGSTFACLLDSPVFAGCATPKSYSGLANGTHAFAVRARDRYGNADPTPAARSWVVDTLAAALSRYRVKPKTFRAASRGGSVRSTRRRRIGTKVSFRLSEPATVTFYVERRKAGRKVRGKCRKRTRRNRRRRKCDLRLKGSFKRAGKVGSNSFVFTGRLRGRKLKPGRYNLVARTTDAAGNKSKRKRVKFRIVRR